MNPGDTITIHMFDAPAPGGGKAFKVVIDDLTTAHQRLHAGLRGQRLPEHLDRPTAPARRSTSSRSSTRPSPATSSRGPRSQTDISTEFETGHCEPCTLAQRPARPPTRSTRPTRAATYNECQGPYENAGPPDGTTPESGDALCYSRATPIPATTGRAPPRAGPDDRLPGQRVPERRPRLRRHARTGRSGRRATDADQVPVHVRRQFPTSNGHQYSQFFFQTDVALSESTCCNRRQRPQRLHGAAAGSWQLLPVLEPRCTSVGFCALEFGNVSARGPFLTDFGKDAQYGTTSSARWATPSSRVRSATTPAIIGRKRAKSYARARSPAVGGLAPASDHGNASEGLVSQCSQSSWRWPGRRRPCGPAARW